MDLDIQKGPGTTNPTYTLKDTEVFRESEVTWGFFHYAGVIARKPFIVQGSILYVYMCVYIDHLFIHVQCLEKHAWQ